MIARHLRTLPSPGTPGTDREYLPSIPLDVEPVEGWTGGELPKAPAAFVHGYQSLAKKIARQVSSASGFYPDDGTGTTAASAGSGQADVKLAATVLQTQAAGLDPIGLLLAGRYATGPDLWEVVRIISWNAGTQVVTASRVLANTWASGSKYHLLFDVRLGEQLHVLSEFSASNTSATVLPFFFSWDAPTLIRSPVGDLSLGNTGLLGAAGEVQESGYYYGRLRSAGCRGLMGCKLRLNAVANGSVSLWCARS